MSETQWPYTLHISLNQRTQEGPVLAVITIFQISDVSAPKPDVLVFTG
jgi:hypothetical protein